jgi:hypothetical protein
MAVSVRFGIELLNLRIADARVKDFERRLISP